MNRKSLALGRKNMITTKEICWLAGLLEGEGSFSIYPNGPNGGISPRLRLSMGDKDVVERVAHLFKTKVYKYDDYRGNTPRKSMYVTVAGSNLAIQWMMTIYSLMGERRRNKIKEILDIWKSYVQIIRTSKTTTTYRLIRNYA